MSPADLSEQEPVFHLKGSMLAITVLELTHNDLHRLNRQLAQKVEQAPNFFGNTPLVLDLDKLGEGQPPIDLPALMRICQQHGLCTLALRAKRAEHLAAAQAINLPILPPPGAREPSLDTPEKASEAVIAPEPPEPLCRPSKIIRAPVRGGQQIYAQGGDLVVLAQVSPGAELLADGNIHVYAPMYGRALAGVKGDRNARIFCRQLSAELLAIAGQYKVAEDLRREPLWATAVQVSLEGDMLNITRL